MNENMNISPEEAAYKEAFNKALDDMLEPASRPSVTQDTTVENSSSSEKENEDLAPRMSASEWDDKDYAQRQAAHEAAAEPESTAPRKRGRPRKDESAVDTQVEYEKLYNDYKQNAEAQLGLYRSRINNLAQELKELRNKQEAKPIEPAEMPDEVREVFDMYPDIGKAVSAYVNSQLNHTKQSLVRDVEQQINPIKSQMAYNDAQKHENAIKAAHPDLQEILQSGDLIRWMDSLSPVMQAGARHVYQYGDTNAVISLLDDYKHARGMNGKRKHSSDARAAREQQGSELRSSAANSRTAKHQELYGNPGSESYPRGNHDDRGNPDYSDFGVNDEDDPLVQRVLNALAVKSNKAPVNISNLSRQREKSAEDIFKEVTREYESNHKRR